MDDLAYRLGRRRDEFKSLRVHEFTGLMFDALSIKVVRDRYGVGRALLKL